MNKCLLSVLFVPVLLSTLMAQTGPDQLSTLLDYYNAEYPQEKVYLHFDKPYYSTGEDIWFQAYLVAGALHEPSPFSTNIYVELWSEDGQLIRRNNLLAEGGVAKGDFHIPREFKTGSYFIRAYTRWMQNFDQEYFFTKKISIVKPTDTFNSSPPDSLTLEVQFYPEGGHLVEGLVSRVALTVMSPSRIGGNREIRILREDGFELSKFLTNSDGIGVFNFLPEQGTNYYAVIDGDDRKFELPEPLASGYVLSVDNLSDKDKAIVTVRSRGQNEKVFVIAQTRGAIAYADEHKLQSNEVSFSIPKKDLLSGITQITLFDEQGIPHAERLMFYLSPNPPVAKIETDKPAYSTRDSTTIKIKVLDAESNPAVGSFSMSVIDSVRINGARFSENIVSNLLLTSDLKGVITNPLRFFKTPDDSTRAEELDRIMMVHGWRRFTWESLREETFPEVRFGVEQGITIQGTLKTAQDGDPIVGGKVSHVGTFNGEPDFMSTESLKDGFFALGNLRYYENEEVYLEGTFTKKNRKKEQKGYIEIDTVSASFPAFTFNQSRIFGIDSSLVEESVTSRIELESLKGLYEFDEDVRDLGEFVVEGLSAEEKYKREGLYYSLDFDSLVQEVDDSYSIFHQLRAKLPGLKIIGFGSGAGVQLNYGKGKDGSPIILVDGVRLTPSQIAAYPPKAFKKVEIHKGIKEILTWSESGLAAIFRIQGGGGIIELTTRTKEEYEDYYKLLGDERVSSPFGGYYKSREFSAPRYAPETPMDMIPDLRTMIHWEPLIKTDENGEATITYFNADLPTRVSIYLEGLTDQGVPIVGAQTYSVVEKEDN